MRIATRRRLGVLLWVIGAAVAAVWAWTLERQTAPVWGVGKSESVLVGAPEFGRLTAVEVDLNDAVSAGQVVARIDPVPIEALREVLAAELLALAGPTADSVQDELKAARDRAKAMRKRAELTTLEVQLKRMRPLVAQGVVQAFEVRELEQKKAQLERELSGSSATAEEPAGAWEVVAAAKRLEEVELRIDALSMRSTLDGQIAEVLHHPGEIVQAGEPVVRVRPVQVAEVVAWVDPRHPEVVPGAASTIVRADGTELSAAVVSVGAGPTLRPARSWTDPRREEWGVAVVLRLQDGQTVRPDEPVMVLL